MKHTYRDPSHVWVAHNLDGAEIDRAHNSGGHFYFRGKTIFSYRDSFPLGTFVEREGVKGVLVQARKYSVTTGRHQGCVRSALRNRDIPQFCVSMEGDMSDLLTKSYSRGARCGILAAWRREYMTRIARTNLVAQRARAHRDWRAEQVMAEVKEAQAFCAFFGLHPIGDVSRIAEELAKADKRDAAKRRKDQAEREERERIRAIEYDARQQEKLAAWLAGEKLGGYFSYSDPNGYCRLRIAENEVQTSINASVPVSHAKRAYRIICKLKDAGGLPWESNGHTIPVGLYKLESIDADGNVKAGCHRIPWSEVERIGQALELIVTDIELMPDTEETA